MNTWLFQVNDKQDDFRFTVYEDGTVYGKERGNKLGILSINAMNELRTLINENMYMFRKLKYFNEGSNQLVLRVNNMSKKKYTIKIVGWSQTLKIWNIICNKSNYVKMI